MLCHVEIIVIKKTQRVFRKKRKNHYIIYLNALQLNLYLTDTFRQQTRRNYNVGHLSIVIFISKRRMSVV